MQVQAKTMGGDPVAGASVTFEIDVFSDQDDAVQGKDRARVATAPQKRFRGETSPAAHKR